MSRDLKSIVHEAYDDLVSQGCAHRDARTIFRAIAKLLPAGDLAGDLARMGESHSDEWHTYAEDWANRMDCALEALPKLAPQNCTSSICGAHLSGADLGQRILAAREHASLGQDQLAKMVGLEQTSISQLEKGRTKRTSYLAEIARACGVDVNWLAFGSEVAQ